MSILQSNTLSTSVSSELLNVKFVSLNNQQASELVLLLEDALSQLNLPLNDIQKRQLLLYLDKLLTWNKAYNLTAIKQPKEALIKHVFDCLTIVPLLRAGSLLDIGTGAGLPSIIVAICQPDRPVMALDCNQKKIRFIKQVINDLHLNNVTANAIRIEEFEGKFAVITSRAFASLTDFVEVALPYLSPKGYLQAMKGVAPSNEEINRLQRCKEGELDITVLPLSVPYLADSRHLIELAYPHPT